MRKLRILSIIVFLIAVVSFGLFKRDQLAAKDRKGPEITMDSEEIEVSCSADAGQLLSGVHAMDNRDGDVTSTLMVESMSNFLEKGRRNITLAAFDSSNNVTKATRTIVYTDYQSPRFALTEPLRFPVKTQNILGTLSASDVLDGDLTGNIKISSEYSITEDEPGEYPMVFTVANSAGDVSKLGVNMEIYDAAEESRNPQFELSDYLVYTQPGKKLDPWDYVQKITVNGTEYVRYGNTLRDQNPRENQEPAAISKGDVRIEDDVDYDTPGTYEIVYRYAADKNTEDREGHIRLIVVVSE